MKVAKCSENGGGEIFVTGEHTHDDNLDDGGVDVPSVDLGAENEVDGAEQVVISASLVNIFDED